jgi:hypothetical protein
MARTRHLPSLCRDLWIFQRNLSPQSQTSQGFEIRTRPGDIYVGNKDAQVRCHCQRLQGKTPHLARLLVEIDVQWALLRLLFDLRGISEGEFKVLSERLDEIGKQTQAWINWERKSSKKSP